MESTPVIAWLTDFGRQDAYVASMLGVALRIAPAARHLEISHAIEPGDVRGAALVLEEALRWLPAATAVVVVVDPGVGTDRRGVAVRSGGRWLVGPDNGVLHPAATRDPLAEWRDLAHDDLRLEPVAATFHGRDLFTPAAARLATGFPFADVGPVVADPVRPEGWEPRRSGGTLEGIVLRVDRFGNVVTSVRAHDLEDAFPGVPLPTLDVDLGGLHIDEFAATYGLAPPDTPFVLLGSGGRLEIAVRDGSAAAHLGFGVDTPVTVRRRGAR